MLPPAFSWSLAWRYLVTRWITLLGMVGVAVAVWALVVVISVFNGFISDYSDDIRAASAPLLVTNLAKGTSYETVREVLEHDAEVEATSPRIVHYAILYPQDRGLRIALPTQTLNTMPRFHNYVQLLGIDPEREQKVTDFQKWLTNVQTNPPSWGLSGFSYAVPDPANPFRLTKPELRPMLRRLAQLGILDWRDLKWIRSLVRPMPAIVPAVGQLRSRMLQGQKVDVLTARFSTPEDDGEPELLKVREFFHVSGGYSTGHPLLDNLFVLIDLGDLREMLGEDRDFGLDLVTEVGIKLRDGIPLAPAAERLQKLLRDKLPDQSKCQVADWQIQNKEYLDAVKQERAMMALVLYVVMIIAASLIYATLLMMVTQKVKDIGILTSMGATPGSVSAIFVVGGAAVGLIGGLVGAGAGVLFLEYRNEIDAAVRSVFQVSLFPPALFQMDGIPCRIEPMSILLVVVSAFALSLIVSFRPARRAARLSPVLALKSD